MEVAVYNTQGKKTGTAKLDDAVFGIEPNDHVIWLDVKRYRNAQRQGTHKSKERAEIAGSTKKLFRQKGTGNARVGSAKSPTRRGGGTAFGPRPRNYTIQLNKKTKRLARMSALSYKAKDNEILMIDAWSMDAPKTKDFVQALSNLKLADNKTLVVVPENNGNIYMSSRNVQGHKVQAAGNLTTYEILDCDKLIFVGNAHEIVANALNA